MKENKTFYASRILACVFMTALGCGMASAQVSSKASLIQRNRFRHLIIRLIVLPMFQTESCLPCVIFRFHITRRYLIWRLIRQVVLLPFYVRKMKSVSFLSVRKTSVCLN